MSGKPQTVKGTRDFGPVQSMKRQYIFNTIKARFENAGFSPIETPSMETLKTLTGKYGEEGDRLIFKILNSGDFKRKVDAEKWGNTEASHLIPSLCEKALRYDLTVPFARFVTMNRNDLTFPFRRYQIQPVWRADRPQKGRYREFYQCDADIIGSDSLVLEAELLSLFSQVLQDFKIPGYVIHLNNRKVLAGIAEAIGQPEDMMAMTIALDKLDKIGVDGVVKELETAGIKDIDTLKKVMAITGSNEEKLTQLDAIIGQTETGAAGIQELKEVFELMQSLNVSHQEVNFNPTLARGLNYYTGAIFEVGVKDASVGSICGGGRYDDLTGIFGMPGISGIGISFGADRIYDVLEEFDLFPSSRPSKTQVLITRFEGVDVTGLLSLTLLLRNDGMATEIYPDALKPNKLKKQFQYANDNGIPYVIVAGTEEWNNGEVAVKNMETGDQAPVKIEDISSYFALANSF